jgi:RNA polymerase sigma-70 factor, ECF subfamily
LVVDEPMRAELVRRSVQGDADALQRLIVHYHGMLHAQVEKRLSAKLRRHVDAEDVLQHTYIAAFKSIKDQTFDGPGGFYKWIERIAVEKQQTIERDLRRQKRDVGRDWHADSARLPPMGSASYATLLSLLPASADSPSQHIAAREASAAVVSSLARLTDEQRDVIRMRFLEDLPVSEIAAVMGKSEPAIYMLCARGLKALSGFLGTIVPPSGRA